ncbi:hypothetical protein C7E12_08255, partial [Stenotrophomonas maltophilia]
MIGVRPLCAAKGSDPQNPPRNPPCANNRGFLAATQGSHNVAGSSCWHGTAQPANPVVRHPGPRTAPAGSVRGAGDRSAGRVPVLAGLRTRGPP